MPTFKISSEVAHHMAGPTGILETSTFVNSPSFGTTGGGAIRVMRGAIPTQQELEDAYPAWDRFAGSPNDILIEIDIVAAATDYDFSNEQFWYNLRTGTAINTGTATWFIWTGNIAYNPTDRGDAPGAPDGRYLPAIVGTISEIGGSPIGDAQMVDVNIVTGQDYELGGRLIFEIPRVYTW